jgi:pimeloyl-ACP methyl ester carboxylesterase
LTKPAARRINGRKTSRSLQGFSVSTQARLAWLPFLLLFASAIRAETPAAAAAPANKITIGGLTLKFCNAGYSGYCGKLKRPLDPTGGIKGTITIGFEYYPRFDQSTPSRGTLLPQEGGPGYSSTGTRDAYLNIFGTLREHRDVLIIDKRGTGTSGAIDCRDIQTGDPSAPDALQACGNQLGAKAYLYGTHLAVDDIAAVLDALQIEEVDFYGDSYGTFVGQTFAAWHPERLRSLILDSAYPVRPSDIWFPTDWTTGRDGLDLVCERSPSCRALGGQATARIERLLRELRRAPIRGTAPDADGIPLDVTVDVSMLFLLMTNLGNSPITYRDLDAAARAWFDDHDKLPLLRLAAEYNTPFVSDAVDFSYGQYQAVLCQEYPLHYALDDSPAKRRKQYARGIEDARQNRPDLFAPFTIEEALQSQATFTPLATCLDWPKPLPAYPQGDPLPAQPKFPNVPTLVLSGDLDSVTSPQDATQAAAQFPNVTHFIFLQRRRLSAGWRRPDSLRAADRASLHRATVARRYELHSERSPDPHGAEVCIGSRAARAGAGDERQRSGHARSESRSGGARNCGRCVLALSRHLRHRRRPARRRVHVHAAAVRLRVRAEPRAVDR